MKITVSSDSNPDLRFTFEVHSREEARDAFQTYVPLLLESPYASPAKGAQSGIVSMLGGRTALPHGPAPIAPAAGKDAGPRPGSGDQGAKAPDRPLALAETRPEEHADLYDAVTDLPSPLLLSIRLEHTLARVRRNGELGAVLYIGPDGQGGFGAQEEVLQGVAQRLKRRWRELDTLARFEGDCFVLVLENLSAALDAESLALEMLRLLQTPLTLADGSSAHVGAAVGISLFPEHGVEAELLLQSARSAYKLAWTQGSGGYRIYELTFPTSLSFPR